MLIYRNPISFIRNYDSDAPTPNAQESDRSADFGPLSKVGNDIDTGDGDGNGSTEQQSFPSDVDSFLVPARYIAPYAPPYVPVWPAS